MDEVDIIFLRFIVASDGSTSDLRVDAPPFANFVTDFALSPGVA